MKKIPKAIRAILFMAVSMGITPSNVCAQAIFGTSPISQPYPYVQSGSFSGEAVSESPDPLVAYRWPNPQISDGLEIYLQKPMFVSADATAAFENLESLTGDSPNVTVKGVGFIRIDFGRENAAWLEFDSPDLIGSVEMSVSEYNQPNTFLKKTAVPKKYGNTYRLELNSELYEGVRFGFIHVQSFQKAWHITDVRLVCQIRSTNYNGSFSCSDSMLTRIWYTGAYTVKLNLLKDYLGAILMERGDRFSWTGDAYPAQAASLVAFGNYDFVKKNLAYTSTQSNGIKSYALYWVLSLIDYYKYTGDANTLNTYVSNACSKLDDAYSAYGTNPNLEFYGWDERLGAGFAHSNILENQNAYKMLSIRVWKEFAEIMDALGRTDLRDKYTNYANEKITALKKNAAWHQNYGLHAGTDAITTDLLTGDEKNILFEKNFTDRLNRISLSPFNQYFVIQALALLNKYDDAFSSIQDLWGDMIKNGGTTFYEIYRPSWNEIAAANDPVPNGQCGFTSLCHPWGAGVTKWLSEEVLGIKPTSPGFATFDILPHLGTTLSYVNGKTPTPFGDITVSFDVDSGNYSVTLPVGTTGRIGIPKNGKDISSVKINNETVWEDTFYSFNGIGNASQDDLFVYLTDVQPGTYPMTVAYSGASAPPYSEPTVIYPAECIGIDSTTGGNWGGVYGKDGFVLCNYNGNGQDKKSLPSYVSGVSYYKIFGNQQPQNHVWEANSNEKRALAPTDMNDFPRKATCLYAMGGDQIECTFTSTVSIVGTHDYNVSLYFLDWDKTGREISVEMFDAKTLNLIAPVQIVKNSTGGAYLKFSYNQSATFRINIVRGDNAVLSGIFFDPKSDNTSINPPDPIMEKENAHDFFERILLTSDRLDMSFTPKNANEKIDISLYDTLGRKVITLVNGHFTGNNQVSKTLQNLKYGIYFIAVEVDHQNYLCEKMLVAKQ
jgi:hypothetical protein